MRRAVPSENLQRPPALSLHGEGAAAPGVSARPPLASWGAAAQGPLAMRHKSLSAWQLARDQPTGGPHASSRCTLCPLNLKVNKYIYVSRGKIITVRLDTARRLSCQGPVCFFELRDDFLGFAATSRHQARGKQERGPPHVTAAPCPSICLSPSNPVFRNRCLDSPEATPALCSPRVTLSEGSLPRLPPVLPGWAAVSPSALPRGCGRQRTRGEARPSLSLQTLKGAVRHCCTDCQSPRPLSRGQVTEAPGGTFRDTLPLRVRQGWAGHPCRVVAWAPSLPFPSPGPVLEPACMRGRGHPGTSSQFRGVVSMDDSGYLTPQIITLPPPPMTLSLQNYPLLDNCLPEPSLARSVTLFQCLWI